MKKMRFLQCFDVADAVKDGIDDFNRLPGYAYKKSKVIAPVKKTTVRQAVNFMYLIMLSLFAKIIK